MNSKEALEVLFVSYNFDGNYQQVIEAREKLEQDLERLEKLQQENKELRKITQKMLNGLNNIVECKPKQIRGFILLFIETFEEMLKEVLENE